MRAKTAAILLTLAAGSITSVAQAANTMVQLSPDTYVIRHENRKPFGAFWGSMAKMKAKVVEEANAFAVGKGKIAIPVAEKEIRGAPGQWPTYEYQFRLVSKDAGEAKKAVLLPRVEVKVESTETESPNAQPEAQKDLYGELLKLDDLRKRGLITDAEFEAQKKKLLDGPPPV